MRLFTVTPAAEEILQRGILCSLKYHSLFHSGVSPEQVRQVYYGVFSGVLSEYARLQERFMENADTGNCPADLLEALSSVHWREVQRIHNVWFWRTLELAKADNKVREQRGVNTIFEVDVTNPHFTMQTLYQRIWSPNHPAEVYLAGPEPILMKDCLRAVHYPKGAQTGNIRRLLPEKVLEIPF